MADEYKILERVRKLLTLANDDAASEGERDNALRMAHATLMKHELTLEHLDTHEREKMDPREMFETEGWNLVWCRRLRGAVARMFFCKYIIGGKINATKGKHIWIGRASATATAAYMSDWIIKSILKEADRVYNHRLTPQGRAFCVGAMEKLEERVRSMLVEAQKDFTAAGSSLVVVDIAESEKKLNQEFAENIFSNLKKTKLTTKVHSNSGAYHCGRDYGGTINLNKQVATSKAPLKLK